MKSNNYNINDIVYYYDENKNQAIKVLIKAIAIQPDATIIYNWVLREEKLYSDRNDCIYHAIHRLKKDLSDKIENLQRGLNNNG